MGNLFGAFNRFRDGINRVGTLGEPGGPDPSTSRVEGGGAPPPRSTASMSRPPRNANVEISGKARVEGSPFAAACTSRTQLKAEYDKQPICPRPITGWQVDKDLRADLKRAKSAGKEPLVLVGERHDAAGSLSMELGALHALHAEYGQDATVMFELDEGKFAGFLKAVERLEAKWPAHPTAAAVKAALKDACAELFAGKKPPVDSAGLMLKLLTARQLGLRVTHFDPEHDRGMSAKEERKATPQVREESLRVREQAMVQSIKRQITGGDAMPTVVFSGRFHTPALHEALKDEGSPLITLANLTDDMKRTRWAPKDVQKEDLRRNGYVVAHPDIKRYRTNPGGDACGVTALCAAYLDDLQDLKMEVRPQDGPSSAKASYRSAYATGQALGKAFREIPALDSSADMAAAAKQDVRRGLARAAGAGQKPLVLVGEQHATEGSLALAIGAMLAVRERHGPQATVMFEIDENTLKGALKMLDRLPAAWLEQPGQDARAALRTAVQEVTGEKPTRDQNMLLLKLHAARRLGLRTASFDPEHRAGLAATAAREEGMVASVGKQMAGDDPAVVVIGGRFHLPVLQARLGSTGRLIPLVHLTDDMLAPKERRDAGEELARHSHVLADPAIRRYRTWAPMDVGGSAAACERFSALMHA